MDTLLTADMVLLTLGLLASGYVSGIIAGLLGVGGGIILVPVLFQTFVWFDFPAHLQIHMAVGTSLAIICFTGGQSARSHLKRGAVDIEILKSWAAFIGLGALLGALLARLIVPDGLKLIFATLALVLGARMLRGAKRQGGTGSTLSSRVQKLLAGITGFLSALMGIGGGTLSVPLLGAAGRTCTAPWHLGLPQRHHRRTRRGRLYDWRLVDTGLAAFTLGYVHYWRWR